MVWTGKRSRWNVLKRTGFVGTLNVVVPVSISTVRNLFALLYYVIHATPVQRMTETNMETPSWDDLSLLDGSERGDGLWLNPVFHHIGFTQRVSFYERVTERRDAFLRYGTSSSTPVGQERFLWDHPIACRSFAMFPPLQAAHISMWRESVQARNLYGLTVWDIQRSVSLQ